MRVAIAGTHCCGKSTLIDEFLITHSEYTHEPEAYEVLEEHGETFAAEPSANDFARQLEYNVNRLDEFGPDDNVIFERSPADYLAYLLALEKLRRDPDARLLKEQAIEVTKRGIRNLDILVFVRPNDGDYEVSDDEDPVLRTAVDNYLEQILLDNELDLVVSNHPLVIEASGSIAERVEALNTHLKKRLR